MKKNILTVIMCSILGLGLFISNYFSNSLFAQAPTVSLYERLGEVYAIAGIVDDFVERLLIDPVITANKNVTSSMEKITKAGLKYHITEMICESCGGPQKYTGRPMKDSHSHLNISEAEWQSMEKDFLTTLKKFNVSEKEQNELVAIVRDTKADIVAVKREDTPKAQVAPPADEKPKEVPQAKEGEPAPPPFIPGLPE